jgi:hypothetical protein
MIPFATTSAFQAGGPVLPLRTHAGYSAYRIVISVLGLALASVSVSETTTLSSSTALPGLAGCSESVVWLGSPVERWARLPTEPGGWWMRPLLRLLL